MTVNEILPVVLYILGAILLVALIVLTVKLTITVHKIDKIVDNRSYVDGSDKTIYVYNDKIIVEEDDYFPDGQFLYRHCKSIIVYRGISDPDEIDDVKGIVIFKKFD